MLTSLKECLCVSQQMEFQLHNGSLSLSQEKGSTWRQGSCSVGVAMESHMEPHVEGVAQRLEEICNCTASMLIGGEF